MKSQVNALLDVVEAVYIDASAKCATDVDHRDLRTIRSRVKHEGMSFLTISLPSLGSDFDRCLEEGAIVPSLFRTFKKRGTIPAFLQGMFALVFDIKTGRLLHEPALSAIEGIKQIAVSLKKVRIACAAHRDAKAIAEFKQCECDLQESICQDDIANFIRVSSHIWPNVLHDDDYSSSGYEPKHGPGSTEERVYGNRKYVISRWHERLEKHFPLLETAYSVSAAFSKEFEHVQFVPEEQERPVRVCLVPKTLKSPRIIAIEPVCMQFVQQQLKSLFYKRIETHPLTRGHVNFTDQTVNQDLALESSMSGRFATLDLTSASDRVPLIAAELMLRHVPNLLEAVLACRSKMAKLPSGELLPLMKFASMGSALCFPIEAMYFYTICVMALLEHRAIPVTSQSVFNATREVYVYGDDIVVPVDTVATVCKTLDRYKAKVNTSKSFWKGKFRESCGVDAYLGERITPTYVREVAPTNRQSTKSIVSWVATSNLFYKRGYWRTANVMKDHIERIMGKLPIVTETSSALGWHTFQDNEFAPRYKTRFNSKYQTREIRAWVPVPVRISDRISNYAALQKCLLKLESRPPGVYSGDEDHLLRSARHGAVALQRRWVQPY